MIETIVEILHQLEVILGVNGLAVVLRTYWVLLNSPE